jgi:hypothetical protein
MNASSQLLFTCASVTCLALAQAGEVPADQGTVYVSTAGNDAWSGRLPAPNAERTDGPLASPAKARDLVRTLKASAPRPGSIQVKLRGGTYFLPEVLTLTAADSGTANAPAVWSAYENERPVLSAGQRLTGWTKTAVDGHQAWRCRLPMAADGRGHAFRELWWGGQRLTRARWPKQGTLPVVGLADNEKHDNWFRGVTEFRYAGDDIKAWPTAAQGEAIVANRWAESHLPITAIDPANHVIRFAKRSVFLLEPDDRYWIENVKECLTSPGEFFVDTAEQMVYLLPPSGQDPNTAEVIAPTLVQVLRLAGKPAANQFVEHVAFRGIEFAHTEWYFDHTDGGGLSNRKEAADEWGLKSDPNQSGFGQAAIGVPGAIAGRGVRHCTFENCTVAHVETYGIELGQGCQNNTISHCTLTDLGAGGIKLGETTIRSEPANQAASNVVSDCTITDGGNLFPSCVAFWIGQSPGNTIAHNDIHGFWYTAISIGWTWGYAKSAAQRNVVEYNHIHHIGTKTEGASPILSDMGCVYTLGDQEGTVIRHNRFHDVAGLKYGGWGIYFDEGTTHILAENNLVDRTTHGGFHQHYGKENTVRNNIFAHGRDAQIQRTRVEDHLSFRFERNIVLWDRGPLFSGNWSKPNAAFDGNTYWRVESGDIHFGDLRWAQWQKAGQDLHSKIADPHLATAGPGDFELTAGSSTALAGFVPIDLSTVGPR